MVRFWSLGRSGLLPVSGRPSLRAFAAAVRACGLPRPRVFFDLESPASAGGYDGRRLLLCPSLDFSSGPLFRCSFSVRRFVSRDALWLRAFFALVWLWLLPVRVTEYAECPLLGPCSRWVAFRDAVRCPLSVYVP